MAEYQMTETIMNLPLFKGISREHVYNFIEKIDIEFVTFPAMSTIVSASEVSDELMFVISGEIRKVTRNPVGTFSIAETLGNGAVIGEDSLFGWSRSQAADITALSETVVLRLYKRQYKQLLQFDEIYIINILNQMSLKYQRSRDALLAQNGEGLPDILAMWLVTLTGQYGKDISIEIDDDELAKLTRTTRDELGEQIRRLEFLGLIKKTEKGISVLSRQGIIDLIFK